LYQDKKNTEANDETEKQSDKTKQASFENRYVFRLKTSPFYQSDEISPIVEMTKRNGRLLC